MATTTTTTTTKVRTTKKNGRGWIALGIIGGSLILSAGLATAAYLSPASTTTVVAPLVVPAAAPATTTTTAAPLRPAATRRPVAAAPVRKSSVSLVVCPRPHGGAPYTYSVSADDTDPGAACRDWQASNR